MQAERHVTFGSMLNAVSKEISGLVPIIEDLEKIFSLVSSGEFDRSSYIEKSQAFDLITQKLNAIGGLLSIIAVELPDEIEISTKTVMECISLSDLARSLSCLSSEVVSVTSSEFELF